MRLRRKPWIDEAILKFRPFLYLDLPEGMAGKWRYEFPCSEAPLHVELGTGKGRFITSMADHNRQVNFIGIERQQGVIYYAGKKAAETEPALTNIKLLILDIQRLNLFFAPGEVGCFYINFCDPWPKARHAKRRLTYRSYLRVYAELLAPGGCLCFKTDNRELFNFSVEELESEKWSLSEITYDLHASPAEGDVMTEYEEKFSQKGNRICRLIARPPSSEK